MTEVLALEAAPDPENALAVIPPPLSDPFASSESTSPPEESDVGVPKASESKTLADLALDVSNWTLHSDHELHTYLKRYSTDLFARTKTLENSMRDLAAETDSAYVRLKNTFNQFLMLSNNQFVENRVYDEEQEDLFSGETSQTTVEKQGTEHEKEKEPSVDGKSVNLNNGTAEKEGTKAAAESIVNKYRSALDMGMEALKLFVMMEDDDDEDKSETSSQIDTVLDIYNERPLPFIIGTREFLEDETLGLGAAPEDYSDSESDSSYVSSYSSSDSESDSSSSSRRKQRASHARSSDSEHSSEAAPPPRRRANSDESDTSGLFGRPPGAEPPRRRSNSDESDTSGLFGRPSAPAAAFPASKSTASRRQSVLDEAKESDHSDWTSDSEEDKRKSPKRKPSSVNQRSQEAPPPFAAPTPARKKQFFDSSDDESDVGLFGSAPAAKPRVVATDKPEQVKPPSSASTTLLQKRESSNRRRSNSCSSSSSDEDKELFGSTGTSGRKTPTSAQVPAQGFRLPSMTEAAAGRGKNDEESKPRGLSNNDGETKSSGLFKRLSSAIKDKTKATPKTASAAPAPQPSRRLDFSDDSSEDDESGGLFGAAPAKATTRVGQQPPKAALSQAPSTVAVPAAASQRPTYSDSSSDDDDETGGLFGAPPKTPLSTTASPLLRSQPVQQRVPPRSLFEEEESDESDEGGLFGTKTPATNMTPRAATGRIKSPVSARPAPIVRRDFSDSDSEDDDHGGLFGTSQAANSSAAAPIVPSTPSPPRSRSTESEFKAAPPAVSPAVATSSPLKTTPGSMPASTSVKANLLPPAKPLMNRQVSSDEESDDWSDDDGGLFGVPPSKSTPAKPTAAPTVTTKSSPTPAPVSTPAPSNSLFGPPAGASASAAVHPPPLPNAAARMRTEESDSESDSDWDGDGGLFGPIKKK